MNLSRRRVESSESWDQALLSLPDPHILQSWIWGDLKEIYAWRAERWAWTDDGRIVAAAQVLERRWPNRSGWPHARLLYVPRGPILDWSSVELAKSVLADLAGLARQRGALFIKIDPELVTAVAAPDGRSSFASGDEVSSALGQLGWRRSSEQVQFPSTLRLDLTASEDDLLARMKSKTRYNIRLAERRGVRVRPGGLDDLDVLYAMYTETAVRDGFVIRPREYYRDAWGLPLGSGRAQVFIAEVDGASVAGLILFHFGPTAWYFYGMSRDAHRDRMPSHLLQWEAIRWAKTHGCRTYDFWGAPDTPERDEPMFGVYRFKVGFGADHVRTIGAWDFPVRPLLYRVYSVVLPRALSFMRARQRRATNRMVQPLESA